MQYAILGPVELRSGERRVGVEGRRQAGLLAYLLMHAGQAVSTDRLIEVVWGDRPPEGAHQRLRMAVLRLRRALETCSSPDTPLRTVAGGYALDVRPGELDADAFAARAEEGSHALERGDAAHASQALRAALSLWRGPALADVAYADWAQPEIRRLEELRLTVLERRVDADLRLGGHVALIAELDSLAEHHPSRERFVEQLMVALYRCGRQVDALDVYRRNRARLSAELGLEPGPRLRALEAEVLAQSPSLELLADAARAPQPLRDRPPAPVVALPARPVALLGRGGDSRAVVGLLRRDDVRLVTVTGAGGVGKTTLAIEVAHEAACAFADGAAFVDLAALADPAVVADAVLHVLGCGSAHGASAKTTLRTLLAGKQQLLVLDNFEHLLPAARLVAEILDSAPRLKVLATSRVALDVRAEWRYRLDPLALPESIRPASVTAAPATALFIARAAARDPEFRVTQRNAGSIATVCSRVDGLPLAIELAAARAGTLSPREIADRLDTVLPALGSAGRDVCDRQRTLRATLDWSYRLLDAAQRLAFAKLSVFVGGCTIDAAERVTGDPLEVIESLVDHSLLTRRTSPDGTTRLSMLEPVREYAAERLAASADARTIIDRHGRYYLELAESAAPRLRTAEQLIWQRRLDADAENLNEALEREYRAGEAFRVLRLAIALQEWWKRGRGPAGRAWIEKGLAAAVDPPPKLRADALTTLSLLALQQGDIGQALRCAGHAVELYDDVDDRRAKTVALVGIAVCRLALGEPAAARAAAADAVRNARDLGAWPLGYALIAEALAAPDPAAAAPIADQAARYLRQAGDARAQAWLHGDLGYKALEHGAFEQAHDLITRSLKLSEQIDDQVHHTFDVTHIALWALETGDDARAAAGFRDALTRCSRYGIRAPIPEALMGMATIAANAGDASRAAELVGAAATVRAAEPPTEIERRLHARALHESRHSADCRIWERGYASGCWRSHEQAIALALETAEQGAGDTRA